MLHGGSLLKPPCQNTVQGSSKAKRNGGLDLLKTAVSVSDTGKRTKSSAVSGFFFSPLWRQMFEYAGMFHAAKATKHTMLVIQFELEFNSCFRWLIFTIDNFNRCSLVRTLFLRQSISADVIFTVYRIFDLDSMRKAAPSIAERGQVYDSLLTTIVL